MKNINRVEVILFSNYSFKNLSQRELVRWLGTTAQPAIDKQSSTTTKLHLKTLRDTPPIYMS
jgi:hypothetical protein